MEIRAACDEDFDAIASITNYYIETSTIHFAFEPVAPAALRAQWLAARARYPWLVAEEEGAVAGYAKAGAWRDRAAYAWTAELGVYLADGARGRGLGRALYSELLARLAHRGFRSAIAGITLPNEPSLALHRALGFEPVGTVRDAGWKHGRWCDVAFWQKQLATGDGDPPPIPE
ncbi:MAG TPA: GNAT family N-acetyltransferase [Kofleriaceae bacterium]|nr:GNAT family N-acetyltransferase [Kofleriaceae bacterium]